MKVVLLVLVLLVAWWLFWGRHRGKHADSSAPETPAAEKMVVCAHCRLHVPRSEAVEAEGRFYCSHEHRELDKG